MYNSSRPKLLFDENVIPRKFRQAFEILYWSPACKWMIFVRTDIDIYNLQICEIKKIGRKLCPG